MAEIIDMGTISARGQIAIPIDIREKMHLKEGEKSCIDCFHKEVCGAYIDMMKLVEQFNMGWGDKVIVPCEAWDLAKNCKKYCPIRKNNIPEGISPPTKNEPSD